MYSYSRPNRTALISLPSNGIVLSDVGNDMFPNTNDRIVGVKSRDETNAIEFDCGGILPVHWASVGIRRLASQTDPKPVSSPQCTPSTDSSESLSSRSRCTTSVTTVRLRWDVPNLLRLDLYDRVHLLGRSMVGFGS